MKWRCWKTVQPLGCNVHTPCFASVLWRNPLPRKKFRKNTYQLFHINYSFKRRKRKYDKDEIFHWLLNNRRSFMESLWKSKGHKSTSKTYVLKCSDIRQSRVEQQRFLEWNLGTFAYLSIPFSVELINVPEIENWRTVSSFWLSFQSSIAILTLNIFSITIPWRTGESPCYCHHSLCPWSLQ